MVVGEIGISVLACHCSCGCVGGWQYLARYEDLGNSFNSVVMVMIGHDHLG